MKIQPGFQFGDLLVNDFQTIGLRQQIEIDLLDVFENFIADWHFTDYQRKALRGLLIRCQALGQDEPMVKQIVADCVNAAQVLTTLEASLNRQSVSIA